MSNIFKSDNLERDLALFFVELDKPVDSQHSVNSKNKPIVKKYHRQAYVLALYIGKIQAKHFDDNKFMFLAELLSDVLSNCKLSILGFKQSSLILSRRMIENFYNHIYYYEHPVEYELLNLGRNDYTPLIDLKSYYEAHPVIRPLGDKNIKDLNSHIFNHYQDLCRVVHTKGEDFMGLAKNLEEIRPSFDLSEHLSQINSTMQAVLYLLFKFHRDLTYTHVEKDLISKTFPTNLRASLLS